MDTLTGDETKAVKLRLKSPQGYAAIARRLGVSRQRAHQIVSRARDKLDAAARAGDKNAATVLRALARRADDLRVGGSMGMMELGTTPIRKAIIDALVESGMTKYRLAKMIGLPPGQFNNRFSRNMGVATVEKMFDALGLTVVKK